MKKLKIKGITGMPFFLTKLRGRLDGRRGVVMLQEGHWISHYIEKKQAIYCAFLHAEYHGLETRTAPLHQESATLTVEYADVQKRLTEDDPPPAGGTPSGRARSAERIAGIKPQLQSRNLAIQIRLAEIEEQLRQAVNETAGIQREATFLTARRLQAYLYGVSLAMKRVQNKADITITPAMDSERDYLERHCENDTARRAILAPQTEVN